MNEMVRLHLKQEALFDRVYDGEKVSYIEWSNLKSLKNLEMVRNLKYGSMF